MKITEKIILTYIEKLKERECSENTIKKYKRDLLYFLNFIGNCDLTKEQIIAYKRKITGEYAATSVNSMLASVNGFLDFIGLKEFRVKPVKIQQNNFRDENKNITKDEYTRLVRLAERKNYRLALVLQTICSTGIRISELKFITVEAVNRGFTNVNNKGKSRKIILPSKLCAILRSYIKKEKRISGAVFVTRSGKPLDRSNVWREMKTLCSEANVDESKVFPHNLRHLFAQEHYEKFHDLSRLCDILGHSNVATTRIYTADSGAEHLRQLDSMNLIVGLQHNANYVVNPR